MDFQFDRTNEIRESWDSCPIRRKVVISKLTNRGHHHESRFILIRLTSEFLIQCYCYLIRCCSSILWTWKLCRKDLISSSGILKLVFKESDHLGNWLQSHAILYRRIYHFIKYIVTMSVMDSSCEDIRGVWIIDFLCISRDLAFVSLEIAKM